MMRVLHLLHTTRMDGSTLSFINMLRGLVDKGVNAIVVGPKLQTPFSDVLNEIGAEYHEIRIVESVYPVEKNIMYPLRIINLLMRKYNSYIDLRRVVNETKPDIIHTNTGVLSEGYSVAKSHKIHHVWHLREYQDVGLNWAIYPSKKNLIKKLKKTNVITVSKGVLNHFELEESQYARVIYNGILSRYNYQDQVPKDKYFLCASRICEQKGFDDVISVFADFHKEFPNYRLVILGEGDELYIERLKGQAEDLGCDSSIDWLGYKSNVMPYMQKAQALIVASHFEGFGRMTAEACFAGCLVVGRNSGGTKEILAETGGYLFDDNMGFLDALCEVVSLSPDEYKEKALFAQQKARQLYSIEGNVEETYKFYQDILSDEQKG